MAGYTIDFYYESIHGPRSGTRSGSIVLGDVHSIKSIITEISI